jgi:alpha-D-xyloside xylohydrolase
LRRDVYLPSDGDGAGAGWYDFWTGVHHPGGRRIDAPAPYELLPLYVKAGSILPMGPELSHTGERPADPLTLWVYTGQDASFDLYEDDGVSYGYEQGLSSTIPLRWDEAKAALTIGARQGSFPGMLSKREIRIVFVTRDQTVPHSPAPRVARTVVYDGGAVVVKAKAPPA